MDMAFVAKLPRLRELPLTDEADEAFAKVADMPALDDLESAPVVAEGRIDFERRVFELGPPLDVLMVGGRVFSPDAGQPGGWTLFDEGTRDVAVASQPIWMLEALAGLVSAIPADPTAEGVTRYHCDVDLFRADELVPFGIAPVPGYTARLLRSVRLDVSIGSDGRLSHIGFRAGELATSVGLSGYDDPPPLDVDVERSTPAPPLAGPSGGAADAVRSAAVATQAAGTASFTYSVTGHPHAKVIAGAESEQVTRGRLDLAARAYVSVEPEEVLVGSGCLFARGPEGDWMQVAELPLSAPPEAGVLWLMDLVGGVVSASFAGGRYECIADALEADVGTPDGFVVPSVDTVGAARRLPLAVRLDSRGRVRALTYSSGPTRRSLELSDLGAAAPVAVPR